MVSLPQFYFDGTLQENDIVWLDEGTVRHVVQVLRMKAGEQLQLTNGKGAIATASITTAEKKKCGVKITAVTRYQRSTAVLYLGVAFTKNNARNEWLLEKATELGVAGIIPLITARSEKERMRYDRLQHILVSAMLQSQQAYLPVLSEAMPLKEALAKYQSPQKLVAHCIAGQERKQLSEMLKPGVETMMLIGPEGDFTEDEVNLCTQAGYIPVTLGTRRLRTETAAMSVCAYFNLINNE